jgi:hypothetical protein
MPQFLEDGKSSDYEARVAAALAEGQERERLDKEQVQEEGGKWPEDAMYIGDTYNYYHLAAKMSILYILDKKTLGGDKAAEERLLDGIWYDAEGRTVRSRRMTPQEVHDHNAVINSASIDDHSIWTEALISDDYWDGDLAPDYLSEDEEEEYDDDEEEAEGEEDYEHGEGNDKDEEPKDKDAE